MRAALATLLVTVCMTGSGPARAAPGQQAVGTWRVVALLDGVDIVSMDEKQAQKLAGSSIRIQRDFIAVGKEKCHPSEFVESSVQPTLYLRTDAGIDGTRLRLPDPVTVIDIGCTEIFMRDPRHAVVFWNGFFFEVVKVD
ncbi:MAG: hypothetical protein ACXU8N_13260 [Telluria sp.]